MPVGPGPSVEPGGSVGSGDPVGVTGGAVVTIRPVRARTVAPAMDVHDAVIVYASGAVPAGTRTVAPNVPSSAIRAAGRGRPSGIEVRINGLVGICSMASPTHAPNPAPRSVTAAGPRPGRYRR